MTRRGFSIVELLVVIGIISILIGMILPAVLQSREQARSVACRSNLRQIGTLLAAYATENRGQVIPYGPPIGEMPLGDMWIYLILPNFRGGGVLLCPTANTEHEWVSYLMNGIIWPGGVTSGRRKRDPSTIVVMGENWRNSNDTVAWFPAHLTRLPYDPARHGPDLRSNHLYLDLHVDNEPLETRAGGKDPWDPW